MSFPRRPHRVQPRSEVDSDRKISMIMVDCVGGYGSFSRDVIAF